MWFKEHKMAVIIGAVALALAISALVIGIVVGKGASEKKSTTEASETQESTTAEATTEDKKTADAEVESDYGFELYPTSNWGDTGNYGATIAVKISNKSSQDISDWKVEVQVPEGSAAADSWGCDVKVEGTTMTVSGVDWGSQVTAGQTVDNAGFNMSCPNTIEFKVLAAYVNGEKVDSNVKKAQEETTTEEVKKSVQPTAESGTPLDNHGALSVDGTQLVDKNGKPYQLKGVSTHGLAWFPEYVNKDGFQTLRDDWGANVVRLAMYTSEYGGYCDGGDQAQLKALVDQGVNAATELGMYVIIDWHILHDTDPKINQGEAEKFFAEMSAKYADYDNVLYEICNEPNNGCTWEGSIRPYAETIIPIIRKNDPDAIIIVGTPNWSQDVDVVADDITANPLKDASGNEIGKNVMYTVHFYAATHTDSIRSKVTYALGKGVPVFVSEFSLCDASGNGANDYGQADKWFALINDNNLSYCSWSLSNKAETSALIDASCSKTSGWDVSELSETGQWIRKQIRGE